MTTTIEYLLQCKVEDSWYVLGHTHSTEEGARAYGKSIQDDEDETYRIIKREITITESVEDVFTVPAYHPTPEDFAENAASYAQGTQAVDLTGIERYTAEEQSQILEHINELVDTCEHCGFYYSVGDLSDTEYGVVCESCETECLEAAEEEDEG